MTLPLLKRFHPHPTPRLQADWNWIQFGLLALPASPLVAGVTILLTSIILWGRKYQQFLRQPLSWGFAGLMGLLLVSATQALDVGTAFIGLYNFIPFFWVFFTLSHLVQTPQQLRQITWLLIITSLPILLVGFGQQFLGWAGHLQVLWILVDLVMDRGGNPPGRMASFLANANVLASYLTIVSILTLPLWIEQWELWRTKTQQTWQFWGQWGILTLSLVGMAIAILYTSSRNAWAVGMVACFAFLLYKGWRWLVLACVGGISTVLLAAFGPSALKQPLRALVPAFLWARLSDELYPNRPVAELRRTQWQFAWSLIEQHPWTGWGLRSFSQLYEAQMNFWVGHPHNLFLMLMAETGIPATLVLIALVAWILGQGTLHCWHWPQQTLSQHQDRFILFSYLVAFASCTLLSLVDVTLFDLRVNVLGWLTLAAIYGLTCRPTAEAG